MNGFYRRKKVAAASARDAAAAARDEAIAAELSSLRTKVKTMEEEAIGSSQLTQRLTQQLVDTNNDIDTGSNIVREACDALESDGT